MDNTTTSAVELAATIGANKVKEVIGTWKEERLKSMKSWSVFCDKNKFSLPNLTNPLFLLALGGCAFLWVYFFKLRKEPVVIRNYTVTDNQKTVVLALVTLFFFYFASVGDTLVYLIGLTATVVFFHSLFFTPVEESDFDFNTEYVEQKV